MIDRGQQEREIAEGENETGKWERESLIVIFRVDFPLRVRCRPGMTPPWEPHLGGAGQGPEVDPQKVR
jgi:hypothetical protein